MLLSTTDFHELCRRHSEMHLSLVIPGRAKREPGISRFRVRCVASPRNDDASAFSPSLRAQAKQSMARQAEAWIASSLSLLAMTAVRHSRDANAPEFCHNVSLHKSEGAGNAGGALHPRSHTQMEKGRA